LRYAGAGSSFASRRLYRSRSSDELGCRSRAVMPDCRNFCPLELPILCIDRFHRGLAASYPLVLLPRAAVPSVQDLFTSPPGSSSLYVW